MKEYNPKDVSVVFAGKIISGWADGSMIKAGRNEQAWTLKVGVDGEGTRSKTNNKSGKVTITLMQSSASNDDLNALALADEISNAGSGTFLMRDGSGRTLVSAANMWIQKTADADFEREVKERTWVLETDVLAISNGGN